MLGGHVGGFQRARLQRVDGSHVEQYSATPALLHLPQAGAGEQEAAVEVDGDHPPPVGVREVDQRSDVLDAGVRHHDVHRPELSRAGLDAGFHLALVGHVHRHRQAGDLLRGGFRALGVDVGEANLGALLRESPGDGET